MYNTLTLTLTLTLTKTLAPTRTLTHTLLQVQGIYYNTSLTISADAALPTCIEGEIARTKP